MKLYRSPEVYRKVLTKVQTLPSLQDVAKFYQVSYNYLNNFLHYGKHHYQDVYKDVKDRILIPVTRKKATKFPEGFHKEIRKRMKNGELLKDIATEVGTSSSSLSHYLARNKEKVVKTSKIRKSENIEEIKNMLESGKGVKEIAKHFNTDLSWMYRIIASEGLSLKPVKTKVKEETKAEIIKDFAKKFDVDELKYGEEIGVTNEDVNKAVEAMLEEYKPIQVFQQFIPSIFNNSEQAVLELVKFCLEEKQELSLENIVICYCNNVRSSHKYFWEDYDIYQEYEANSKLFRREILPSIKQWWNRNLGSLVMKSGIQIK